MRALDGNSMEEGHGVCSIQGIRARHPGKGEQVVTDVVWICLVNIWSYPNWSYCFMFIVCKLCYCLKFSRDIIALFIAYTQSGSPPLLHPGVRRGKRFEQSFDWDKGSPPERVGTAG